MFFSLTPYSLDQNLDSFLCKNEQSEYTKNQGRLASYPTTPSQIPACGFPAQGSSKRLTLHEQSQ